MIVKTITLSLVCALVVLSLCCRDEDKSVAPPPLVVTVDSFPKFVRFNYIELDKIFRISTFRSAVGHDYSDNFESCRSMKHYFEPKASVDWSSVKIFSPITGTINTVREEWAGTQVQIQSTENPAYQFIIFHINPTKSFTVGQSVAAGELLGTHIGSQTMSDVAVGLNASHGWKLVSFFSVMTDSLFALYQLRGVQTRSVLIHSKEARNADTLKCSGGAFVSGSKLPDWVVLQ